MADTLLDADVVFFARKHAITILAFRLRARLLFSVRHRPLRAGSQQRPLAYYLFISRHISAHFELITRYFGATKSSLLFP